MDNLSAHKGTDIRRWAKKHRVELCFTPTYASWANPIEAHFGPLRQFTIANSNHPDHTVQTRALHAYLRWRNANARHRDVLAAERKERARIRSEKGIRADARLRRRGITDSAHDATTTAYAEVAPGFGAATGSRSSRSCTRRAVVAVEAQLLPNCRS
ncbi:transposase (plasmid) [Streptomyces sp. NBC_00841]|nr:transposase [Streptomyces sp. NBC_01669]WSA05452.1 transposase [Streptomyces sp. NBC_00841]